MSALTGGGRGDGGPSLEEEETGRVAIANIVWCMAYTRGSGGGSHSAH